MSAPGTTLFSRGGEQNSDFDEIWDDSALIQAYDRAINTAKDTIRFRRESSASGSVSESSSVAVKTPIHMNDGSKRSPYRRKWHNKQKKSKHKWKVGNRCRAVYSVDGCTYEAEITSISAPEGTCIVNFVGYGNSEVVFLSELQPSAGDSPRQAQLRDAEQVNRQMEGCDKKISHNKNHKGKHNDGKQFKSKKSPSFSHLPFPPAMMQSGSGSCHQPFFMPQPFPCFPFGSASSIPPMPIPPPPVVEDAEEEDEALASMLMSWYMSGYHTGYFQGLKAGKNKANYCSSNASGAESSHRHNYR